jgi:hypothetical protein
MAGAREQLRLNASFDGAAGPAGSASPAPARAGGEEGGSGGGGSVSAMLSLRSELEAMKQSILRSAVAAQTDRAAGSPRAEAGTPAAGFGRGAPAGGSGAAAAAAGGSAHLLGSAILTTYFGSPQAGAAPDAPGQAEAVGAGTGSIGGNG